MFIDIFSNTNAALAKPTLSGSALHRFKMKITKEMVKATVVVVSGKGSKKIGNWVVYKKDVYNEMTIEQYKEYKKIIAYLLQILRPILQEMLIQ